MLRGGGGGGKVLCMKSGSNAQRGCHTHRCSKISFSVQNRSTHFHETWYVVSGTPAYRNLFKLSLG